MLMVDGEHGPSISPLDQTHLANLWQGGLDPSKNCPAHRLKNVRNRFVYVILKMNYSFYQLLLLLGIIIFYNFNIFFDL